MTKDVEIVGYFVCSEGAIWTVYQTGLYFHSNFYEGIEVDFGNQEVNVLGEWFLDDNGKEYRPIEDSYVLWTSLTDLAYAIEKP